MIRLGFAIGLILTSCNMSETDSEGALSYKTHYQSGTIKSEYNHFDGVIKDTLTLYDSSGGIALRGIYAKVGTQNKFTVIEEHSDTVKYYKERNIDRVKHVVDSNWYKVDSIFAFRSKSKRISGKATFKVWVRHDGIATYAICTANSARNQILIYDIIQTLESWKFDFEDSTQHQPFLQTVNFN